MLFTTFLVDRTNIAHSPLNSYQNISASSYISISVPYLTSFIGTPPDHADVAFGIFLKPFLTCCLVVSSAFCSFSCTRRVCALFFPFNSCLDWSHLSIPIKFIVVLYHSFFLKFSIVSHSCNSQVPTNYLFNSLHFTSHISFFPRFFLFTTSLSTSVLTLLYTSIFMEPI